MTNNRAHCSGYVETFYNLFDAPNSKQPYVNSSCRDSCSDRMGVCLVCSGSTGVTPQFVTSQSEENKILEMFRARNWHFNMLKSSKMLIYGFDMDPLNAAFKSSGRYLFLMITL